MFRLCLSAVLLLFVTSVFSEPSRQIKDEIISRCRASMMEFGASLVKDCVDQDITAYEQLRTYSTEWQSVINRCQGQMLSVGGWYLVKACADQDIVAEKALRDM